MNCPVLLRCSLIHVFFRVLGSYKPVSEIEHRLHPIFTIIDHGFHGVDLFEQLYMSSIKSSSSTARCRFIYDKRAFPACALRYIVTSSLLSPPQGGELDRGTVYTSSPNLRWCGHWRLVFRYAWKHKSVARCDCLLLGRGTALTFSCTKKSMTSPFLEIVSVAKLWLVGSSCDPYTI